MLNDVFAIAREGMATQARRVEAAARVVASAGTTSSSAPQTSPTNSVRTGDLPVGNTIEEAMVTLVEAQAAYRANAMVIKTAADMYDSLLEAVDNDHDHR